MESASTEVARRLEAGDGYEVLRIIRDAQLRAPHIVLDQDSVWRARLHRQDVHFWDMIEQVAYAALDYADRQTFEWATRKIFSMFGSTWRVNRLFGLKREAMGEMEGARTIYENMLEGDPNNRAAMKRQVTWLKSTGKLAEAIAHLTWYLKIFVADIDAWIELGDLHISAGCHAQAIFCYNETVMINAENWAGYLILGDLHYTLGDEENILTARHYYAKSLTINTDNNVRALYGLLLSTQALESTSRSQEMKNKELKAWAQREITATYKRSNPEHLKLLSL